MWEDKICYKNPKFLSYCKLQYAFQPTYYDEDAEMDEEPIGEELDDFEDEEEEEEFYDNRVSMRKGGQRRLVNVQQQLSLADRYIII